MEQEYNVGLAIFTLCALYVFSEENNGIPWMKDQLVPRPTQSQYNMKNCRKDRTLKLDSSREFRSARMLRCIGTT